MRTATDTEAGKEVVAATFGNEDRLPRIPLPTLEESCERFLEWCAPLLSANELAETENAVEAFLLPASPARKLQAALEEYDRGDGVQSWLDDFWAYRYLGRRDRIALNANYFCLFRDSDEGQVARAAGLVAAALDYKLLLDEERIPPVVQHGRVLSMQQNRFLFSATRIPGRELDRLCAPYSESRPGPSRERHIVVFFRGRMFRMDVIGLGGRPYTLDELAAGLRSVIAESAREDAPSASVGHLTAKPRAEWAESRDALLAMDPQNVEMLDAIETALFGLCLEEIAPGDALEACEQLLHGDSANRWFDKAVSLIVFADGAAGVNAEHSGLDGTTMVSFVEALLDRSAAEHSRRSGPRHRVFPRSGPSTSCSTATWRPMFVPPPRRSRRLRRKRPPRWSRWRTSAATGPSSCGSRRTRSCRWPSSSRTCGRGDSWAPPMSPSRPGTSVTGARRRCGL